MGAEVRSCLDCPSSLEGYDPRQLRCHPCKKTHRQTCVREATQRWRDALHEEVLAAYGGACVCCGETTKLFLTIDHINNDGAQHRADDKAYGNDIYPMLKKLGFPRDRFQLLCWNCNSGRYLNGGVCPHQERA